MEGSWRDLGGILGDLEGILGASWGHLEVSWAILGHLGAILGLSWGHLGASWGYRGAIFWAISGHILSLRTVVLPGTLTRIVGTAMNYVLASASSSGDFGHLGNMLSSFDARNLKRASRSHAKTGLCWG